MAQYIFMNGTQFNPTSVATDEEKVGISKRMLDTTLRYYHQGTKRKWTIAWNKLRASYLPAIRTIAQLTSSFTFIDHEGNAHTVVILPGGFKHTLSAEGVDSAGIQRYDIELVLDEV